MKWLVLVIALIVFGALVAGAWPPVDPHPAKVGALG
jgi:hypothetical protein